MVIEEGVTISGQPLRYYLEARNHAEALDQVSALAEQYVPITADTILLLHRLMMDDVLPDAGQWRVGYVHIRGANYTPPHPREVPQLMADWVAWLEGDGLAYAPVVRAALAHVVFEAIHPFSDGNGRVGRLLLNLMLMREEFPPALLPQEWRTGYMHGLHLAQTSGNHTPICNLLGRAVEQALDRNLESIEASDAIPLPLSEVAERTGYRAEHLAWLVRKGRLPAVKRGRRWFASVEAVERYRQEVEARTIPRGRPPTIT
jgi:Fic family protein